MNIGSIQYAHVQTSEKTVILRIGANPRGRALNFPEIHIR